MTEWEYMDKDISKAGFLCLVHFPLNKSDYPLYALLNLIEPHMANNKLPSYDELPIDSKYPDHTAWGLWGDDDNLGTLNLLTEERIANVSGQFSPFLS